MVHNESIGQAALHSNYGKVFKASVDAVVLCLGICHEKHNQVQLRPLPLHGLRTEGFSTRDSSTNCHVLRELDVIIA